MRSTQGEPLMGECGIGITLYILKILNLIGRTPLGATLRWRGWCRESFPAHPRHPLVISSHIIPIRIVEVLHRLIDALQASVPEIGSRAHVSMRLHRL
jgi:hypothetical protein